MYRRRYAEGMYVEKKKWLGDLRGLYTLRCRRVNAGKSRNGGIQAMNSSSLHRAGGQGIASPC